MNPDKADAAAYLHYFSTAISTLAHPRPRHPPQNPPANNRTRAKHPGNRSQQLPTDPPQLADFPPLPTSTPPPPPPASHQPNTTPTKPPPPTSEYSPPPASSQFHAACIHQCPHLLPSSLLALISALRIRTTHPLTRAVAGHTTTDALLTHATQVTAKLSPLLPPPLLHSLSTLRPLSHLRPPAAPPFPIPPGPSWIPPLPTSPPLEQPPAPLSQRLTAKLELAWDATLTLQRRFRGDFHACPPGTFDPRSAARILADLHPATTDVYAARLVHLVSAASLTHTDPKMRRLDARMRAPALDAPIPHLAGVVLHRMPPVVRHMFRDPAHAFFLEFLTAVDSARLNAALTPRLARALVSAMGIAAGATSNAAFSEAVVDARLFAKLLCVTLNAPNWAHSEFALSGGGEGQGLSLDALRGRVDGHEAAWVTSFDLGKVLRSALGNGGVLPVFVGVAVADVIVKLCAVDPVAREGRWYRRALAVLSALDARLRGTGRFPLLDCMLVDLLDGELCNAETGNLEIEEGGGGTLEVLEGAEECAGIGDDRLMSECCPSLEAVRQAVESNNMPAEPIPSNGKRPTRRIQPVAAAGASDNIDKDSVESMLKSEFVSRMDGKLRELIAVVATARAGNPDGAEKAYMEIAKLLYPDSAETVVEVAAKLCGERSESMGAKGHHKPKIGSKALSEQENGNNRQRKGAVCEDGGTASVDRGEEQCATAKLPGIGGIRIRDQEKMKNLEKRFAGAQIGFR